METKEIMVEPRQVYGSMRSQRKDGDNQVYTFVASTSDEDRHKSVLNQKNWSLANFNSNPIIGYQHNLYGDMCSAPDPDDVIGKGFAYVVDNELMIDVVFDQENERALKVQSKVERGFLNAVSVGFMEIGDGHYGNEDDHENKDLYYFHGQELLEVSVVNIPSNPKALKKTMRSQTYDALRYIYQQLDGKYRFSDIEDMRVKDVIDLLEGRDIESKKVSVITKRIFVNGQDSGVDIKFSTNI